MMRRSFTDTEPVPGAYAMRWFALLGVLLAAGSLLAGCASESALPSEPSPAYQQSAGSAEERTLVSLTLVDPYPLYTMHYYAEYPKPVGMRLGGHPPATWPWGCSLFAALGDAQNLSFGRNFDWLYSPAVLLFTDPPDGYASVTMVDIAYLFDEDGVAQSLAELPPESRAPLLDAPQIPFDGMNERGLAVGMAAVSSVQVPQDPSKPTTDSLAIMRHVLDQAATVAEAVGLFGSFNLDWGSGPQVHYLVADAEGQAALLEFDSEGLHVIPGTRSWHQATNFRVAPLAGDLLGICPRYDRIHGSLSKTRGVLAPDEAIQLLREVSSDDATYGTQWSVLYDLTRRRVHVVMGHDYPRVYEFALEE
jgi:hypothetical protein